MTSPAEFQRNFNRSGADETAAFQKALEANRAKAVATQEQLRERLLGLADRKELTPEAKQVASRRTYLEHHDQLQAMRDAELKLRHTTRDRVARKHFGAKNGDFAGQRSAYDRAGALTDERAAQDALAAAERNGDEVMAAAIAEKAIESWWFGVANQWAERRPGATEDVKLMLSLGSDPHYTETTMYEAITAGVIDGEHIHRIVTGAQSDLGGDAA